jgi:hypothetical protein
VVAPPFVRTSLSILPEILLAGMVATMLLVESVVLVLMIISPATLALFVTVTPFVTVFLIVVLATAGWCDGGH